MSGEGSSRRHRSQSEDEGGIGPSRTRRRLQQDQPYSVTRSQTSAASRTPTGAVSRTPSTSRVNALFSPNQRSQRTRLSSDAVENPLARDDLGDESLEDIDIEGLGNDGRPSIFGLVPGNILAGVESHLLLLRRSLLLLSHLARPTTGQFIEEKLPAPPTSAAFIENIPESLIETTGIECSICLAKFRRGTKAGVLPCKHQFHFKCIRPWLKKTNSCPLCRHQLPADEQPSTNGVYFVDADGLLRSFRSARVFARRYRGPELDRVLNSSDSSSS